MGAQYQNRGRQVSELETVDGETNRFHLRSTRLSRGVNWPEIGRRMFNGKPKNLMLLRGLSGSHTAHRFLNQETNCIGTSRCFTYFTILVEVPSNQYTLYIRPPGCGECSLGRTIRQQTRMVPSISSPSFQKLIQPHLTERDGIPFLCGDPRGSTPCSCHHTSSLCV